MRDAVGSLTAALVVVAWQASVSSRAILVVTAIATVLPFTFPTVAAWSDEIIARSQFPVLASFESVREMSRFEFEREWDVTLTVAMDGGSRRVPAVRFHLPPGQYPGFVLRYFPRDWRGMRTLSLLLVNTESTPLEMMVRIDDVHYRYYYDDRYNRSFVLVPGPNRIEIPLAEVATAPRGRTFDLAQVYTVIVYAIDLAQPREILVGPIALVH